MPTDASRDTRLNPRASSDQNALIRQAAMTLGKSVTEHVLADRRRFELHDATWDAFQAVLERPAVLKPRLRALLDEPSVFEG